jgi:hypothetical protein
VTDQTDEEAAAREAEVRVEVAETDARRAEEDTAVAEALTEKLSR